jgi:hypothetical protein
MESYAYYKKFLVLKGVQALIDKYHEKLKDAQDIKAKAMENWVPEVSGQAISTLDGRIDERMRFVEELLAFIIKHSPVNEGGANE